MVEDEFVRFSWAFAGTQCPPSPILFPSVKSRLNSLIRFFWSFYFGILNQLPPFF